MRYRALLTAVAMTCYVTGAKTAPLASIVVQDRAEQLAQMTGGERTLIANFTANRSELITILSNTYRIDTDKAAEACDRIVMPELTAHASGFINATAAAIRSHFSAAEIDALISIYQKPVMRKLVAQQVDLLQQILAYSRDTIGIVVKEMFTKHRAELHQLGIDR